MPTNICIVKAMVFLVVMYECENWTIKKARYWRINAFELWGWRRLGRVPWTARRSNQSILKEISPEYSMAELMLKLKLQSFGHLMQKLTHWKRPWCWERLKVGGEGDDRGWDGWVASPIWWTWFWVSSRSWWWTGKPGVLQSWGRKELDMTELLSWTEPTSVVLPGEFHEQRSLVGYSPWGHKELDMIEWQTLSIFRNSSNKCSHMGWSLFTVDSVEINTALCAITYQPNDSFKKIFVPNST